MGKPITRIVWISLCGVWFLGCATKDQILPQDGPTMKEVYDRHFHLSGADDSTDSGPVEWEPASRSVRADLIGYTRTAADEISNRFPILPNPLLVMYVFPHLAGPGGNPVPGYATSFPLYERVEYALPGEVEGW